MEFKASPLVASPRRARIVRARRIRLAGAFALMAVSGLIWNSFGLFLVALEAEFGWSRAGISAAFGTFALANALTAPAFGYALSRWDSRIALAGSALLLGVALAATSTATTLHGFWLVFGVIGGMASHCTASYAVFAVLAARFRQRPATAMSIADAGSGLAAFLGLPLLHWIILSFGWQAAYLMLGSIVAVVGVGVHLFVLDRVKRLPLREPGRHRIALPSFALLVLALSYFCGSAAYHGLLTQQIALFDEQGVPEATAVWIAASAGLVVFLWRLLSGWLCDLWGPRRVMAIAALGAAVTFAALGAALAGASGIALVVYPLALGIAFGGQQVLLTNGARLIVPLSALGVVLGFCRLGSGIGMATGPVLAGALYSAMGGYPLVVGILAAIAFAHFAAFATAIGAIGRRPAG